MPNERTPDRRVRDRKAYKRAYYAANREKVLATNAAWKNSPAGKASQKAYDAAHRKERAVRKTAYRATHREQLKAYAATYRISHSEEHRAQNSTWYKLHPELVVANSNRRRARLAALPSERVLLSVLFTRDKGICQICHTRVFKNARDPFMRPSHDHIIPVSLGGPNTYTNAQLAHRRCNISKGNRGQGQPRLL